MNDKVTDNQTGSGSDLAELFQQAQKEIRKLKKELVIQESEIDAQKELIENQRDVALRQRDQIASQQKEIRSSFTYASRIQTALLTSEDMFHLNFRDHFIVYKPKDIVSGDFYWMTEKEGMLLIAAADATGHGVPGAFMSLMGIVLLNEIVDYLGVTEPAEVLEIMRSRIIEAFSSEGGKERISAGMDMTLVCIEKESLEMKFSGAFNPVYIIRKGELTEIQPNKMPIGYHPYMMDKSFNSHTYQLQEGDRLYLTSDGYIDQFGWRNNKKFMKRKFRELLKEIQSVPVAAQKVLLENRLENWKGDLEQLDDILVLGIEI